MMEPVQPAVSREAGQSLQPNRSAQHIPGQNGYAQRGCVSQDGALSGAGSDTHTTVDHSGLRIDVAGLARLLFYALLLPAAIAISLDFLLELFPILTLATIVTLFPVVGFFVLRNTVREMNQIVEQVAPEDGEGAAPEEDVV